MTAILGLLVLLLALYLAFKVLESALKVMGWLLVLVIGYWLAAPTLDWLPLPELLHLAWLDIGEFALDEWTNALRTLLWPPSTPASD